MQDNDRQHTYPPGYLDELTDRLVAAAKELHVREIDHAPAYLGTAIAVSDMVRELDEALKAGAPLPKRWAREG